MKRLRKGFKAWISAAFLLDIWTLVFKTSSNWDYIIFWENQFQHIFQAIRNFIISLNKFINCCHPSQVTFFPWHGEETAQQPQMCWEFGPSCFPSVSPPLKLTHTITSIFSSGSWLLKLDSCPLPLDSLWFGLIFLKFGAQPLPLNTANLFHFWTIPLFQHPQLMFASFQKHNPLEFPAPFLRNCC